MAKWMTLEEWRDDNYTDKKPSIQTLWRWARNGNFYPPAEKHGKQYRLTPVDYLHQPQGLQPGEKNKGSAEP